MKPLRLNFLSPLASLVTVFALAVIGGILIVNGASMFSPGALSARPGEPLGGVRSHAELSCASCHPPPWSGDVVSERCIGCHTEVGIEVRDHEPLHGSWSSATACLTCHTEHRGADASLTVVDQVPHDSFGFSLARHRAPEGGRAFACDDCHDSSRRSHSMGSCTACHDELQPGFSAAHSLAWGRECLACHDGVDRFSRDQFTHDQYSFRLTGGHVDTACADCHPQTLALSDFAKVASECASCHREPNEHRFGSACAECHSTDTWQGGRFDHDFPTDHGRRAPSSCKTCHPNAPRYDTYTCYDCHEHTPAKIDRKHRKEGITNYQDCARCHPTGREHEGEHGGERGRGSHDDEDDDDGEDDDD